MFRRWFFQAMVWLLTVTSRERKPDEPKEDAS